MVIQERQTVFTYQDYLNTPDDVRYQLIEGALVREPAPTVPHQRVLLKLALLITPFVEDNRLGEVLLAPTDVYLSDTNVVQPDLLFISAARAKIITERDIHGAPDLVVEVASPSTQRRDHGVKLDIYARYGVAEYWLVDPSAKTIETLRLEDGRFIATDHLGPADTLTSPLLPGLVIPLGKLFG